MKISVNSEIGRLKKVLLHRPGKELENLTPDLLERLLFDDIPWLEVAQQEHDAFAEILRSKGVQTYYIENVVAEAIEDPAAKKEFLDTFIKEAVDKNDCIATENKEAAKDLLSTYLMGFTDKKELVDKTIAGVRVEEIPGSEKLVIDDYLFIADPLPNLYFQRDPYASIGNGASINTMYTVTRNRETLYAYIMFKYHPEFKENFGRMWYGRWRDYHIEGGDQLILNKNTVLVGRSERTQMEAIQEIAEKLLRSTENEFKTIIAFDIGSSRKFMHLDTVFTQIDKTKFTVHREAINEKMKIWTMTLDGDKVDVDEDHLSIEEVLQRALNVDKVELIPCGGNDPIASAREQWNDGANTLAIAPGEVVVYSRNPVTNGILEKDGVKLNVMPSAELSRGRGGPRCMSMPLEREAVDWDA